MYFADFETTTAKQSTTSSKIWLWGIKGGLKGDKLYYDIDMKSFFETIKDNKMGLVFFHNISFDGNYIFKWLLKNGFEFRNMMEDDSGELGYNEFQWITTENGNIYALYVNYEGYEIQFLDSWKVLMASVADLGETIGLEKMDLDYDAYDEFKHKKDVPKKAVDYLERDIDVVIKTFTNAISLYNRKMTRASMAYDDFKTFYNESHENGRQFSLDFGGKIWNYRTKSFEWLNVLSKKQWDLVKKSYQGGYTNWNEKYTNKLISTPNGVSYDVNSLYPSVMMNYKIPYGKMLYSKPLEGDYVALKTILIQNATIKDPSWPPLIKKHGGKYREAKYLKNVKYTEYTYWEEELEFIKDKYNINYIEIKTVYFRTKWVFRDWLQTKKELKINAKNELDRSFHKGIQNSCYGKYAQHYRLGSRIIVKDGNHVKEINGVKYLVNIKDGTFVRKLASNVARYGNNGEYKHEVYYSESDQFKHIAVASYITSKARLILWNAQYKNLDLWLYSDTDSCYFTDEPVGIDIHESKYGAWKAEHKFDKFKVLRAKAYVLHSTHAWKKGGWKKHDKLVRKISGLSKEGKKQVNFDNFYIGSIIKGGKRSVVNVDGGKLIYDTDFKLGEEFKY